MVKSFALWTFAGFSTRFLKNGSYSDLPYQIKQIIYPMIVAG
jgi:malate dehydrogenase (quinone)